MPNIPLRLLAERSPGLRRVRRPATGTTPEFDLAVVRTGPRTGTPALVIPGGPGLASALPYRSLRHRTTAAGLDVLMVEHRGIGLSRGDLTGADLPAAAMHIDAVIDDLVAALDAEGVERAVVYGSSYGSYLAAGFGLRHPERVAAMVLDSPLLAADDQLLERDVLRATLWGDETGVPTLGEPIRHLARRVHPEELLVATRAAYELGGPGLLRRVLTARQAGGGRLVWRLLDAYAGRARASIEVYRYLYEFDLVAQLAFRELRYAPALDGLPFDPAITYADAAIDYPGFAGEPFDLYAALPGFDWPTLVLSGRHDLRTPPVIAERAAALLPRARLLRLQTGHSVLESHPLATVRVLELLRDGRAEGLVRAGRDTETNPETDPETNPETNRGPSSDPYSDPDGVAAELNRLPRRGVLAQFPRALKLATRLSAHSTHPAHRPR